VLVAAGADVNSVGFRHDDGPLQVAAAHGQAQLVKFLLAQGANPSAENTLGQTALQIAISNHHTNVISVLSTSDKTAK